MTSQNRDQSINAWYNLNAPRNKHRFQLCTEWKQNGLPAFSAWWHQQYHAGDAQHGVSILLSGRSPTTVAGPDSLVVISKKLVKWLSTNVLKNEKLPLGVVKCGAGFRPRFGRHGDVFTGSIVPTKEEAHRLWQLEKISQFEEFIADHSADPRVVVLLVERKALLQHEYDNHLLTSRV